MRQNSKSREEVRWGSAGILQSQTSDPEAVTVKAVTWRQSLTLSPEGSRDQRTGGDAPTTVPARDPIETRLTFTGACYKLGIVLGTVRNCTKFKGRDWRPEPM